MLVYIKEQALLENNIVLETSMDDDHDSIRDMFLDEDGDSDSSDNTSDFYDISDPELAKLVDSIPEFEGNDISDNDIEKLTESIMPEVILESNWDDISAIEIKLQSLKSSKKRLEARLKNFPNEREESNSILVHFNNEIEKCETRLKELRNQK